MLKTDSSFFVPAFDFQVYEQYEELKPAIGGGFNINGGAVILERLGMGDDVRSIANPMRRVISRTTAGGELFDIDIESTIPSALRGRDGASACYTVMRSELQRVLEQRLPQGERRNSTALSVLKLDVKHSCENVF